MIVYTKVKISKV